MPTWGELLKELAEAQQAPKSTGLTNFDVVRRKYLAALAKRTGRNVILYASKWAQGGADPDSISITAEDMEGFMEVIHGLSGDKLDLILHSPGGSAEATEALVLYVRSKFSDVRVFVPHAAMSAATMFACAANEIVLGKHSFLGPIDPQFIIQSDAGRRAAPAHAILEQFAMAQKECVNPALLPSWLPILRQYGPALIVQCKLAQQLSESLVQDWLERYMFAGTATAKADAMKIATALATHTNFMSHGRFISRDQAKSFGLKIADLEVDQGIQDEVLSIFHASMHTFNGTPCVKLIENHLGKAFIKVQQQMIMLNAKGAPGAPGIPVPLAPNIPGLKKK
jgi:hypothetical protein